MISDQLAAGVATLEEVRKEKRWSYALRIAEECLRAARAERQVMIAANMRGIIADLQKRTRRAKGRAA